jgi:Raf kinase inhibitor-like YbhB/YbcL family protein
LPKTAREPPKIKLVRLTLVVVVVCTLLSGCGLLRGSTVVANAPAAMTITSGAFAGNVLPAEYTCDTAKETSPPLTWAGTPSSAKSIAIVVDDASAPENPYIYWIVFDINPNTTSIPQGALPSGARVALNSAGTAAYDPPCPSGGSHSYRFTVYALDKTLDLPSGTALNTAWMAIASATIGRGRIAPKANP